MQTDLEKDIMEVESFSELMMTMESKGVFVSEETVVERLFEILLPEENDGDSTSGEKPDGLFTKIVKLLNDDADLPKRISPCRIVSYILTGIDRLDPMNKSNPELMIGLFLLSSMAESGSPGILHTIKDAAGYNILGQIFRKLRFLERLDALTSYGYVEMADRFEIRLERFDILGFLRMCGLDAITGMYIFRFGFPKTTKLDKNRTILDILGEIGIETLGKTWKSELSG